MNNNEDNLIKPTSVNMVLDAVTTDVPPILEIETLDTMVSSAPTTIDTTEVLEVKILEVDDELVETVSQTDALLNLNDKSTKIESDLELLKKSFINNKEETEKLELLQDIKFPDIKALLDSADSSLHPNSEKNEAEEDSNAVKSILVILTEEGFSKPVGTFNPLTRIATLTSDIVDSILIIKISDVILDGNNFTINNSKSSFQALVTNSNAKNITIKNLNIITNDFAIFLGENSTDVTITCCKITNSLYGFIANGARNLTLKYNEFLNCIYGLSLNYACSYSTIFQNTFIDNRHNISLYLRNSFNVISENKIILKKSYSNETGIEFRGYNCYNTVLKNIISFSNRTITINEDSIVNTSNAFLIDGFTNTMNLIKENTFEFINNSFNFNVKDIDYKIVQAKIFDNNSEISITKNKFILENNTFNINAENSIEIRQANLFNVKTTDIEISENTFIDKNNTVNYINNDKVSIKSYFINVRYDDSCHCGLVSKNKFFNLSNSINPSQGKIKNYDIIFANVSVNNANIVIEIEDNVFEIQNNTNFTYESSVYIATNNTGVGITRNVFKNKIINPIVLTENNYGNVITCNTFENVETAAIILAKNNGLNIIEDNALKNIEFFGIAVVENNNSNIISKNYFENGSVGILFLLSNNLYNTISKNIFCNTGTTISIPKDSYNYVYENKIDCIEK